uniref:PNPLA domain-containing protein n=1 Tax=Ficedula albicollis TaxID=59894 RepID=U3JKI6_FICAL
MLKISGKEGRPYSLLFRGVSFSIPYEVGVVAALQNLSPDILKSASRIYGSSSGSIVATTGLCGCDMGKGCRFFFYIYIYILLMEYGVAHVKTSLLGLVPGGRMIRLLRRLLNKFLPPNAHELVSGKLHIILTRLHDWRSVTVSEFASREELIQVGAATAAPSGRSWVTFAAWPRPTAQNPRMVWVGWVFKAHPVPGLTITVSAFAGEYDICPKDGPLHLQAVGAMSPLQQPSCPDCHLPLQVMNHFYIQGYQDTVSFLKKLSK